MEKLSILIWLGIFALIVAYFYPLLSSILLGEKKMNGESEPLLEDLIENKKKLLQLTNANALRLGPGQVLLKEAEWGSGDEIAKIHQTLLKYHYQCELSDISMSIKNFFQNEELTKLHTTLVQIETLITTHLCLFHLAHKKSHISAKLMHSFGLKENKIPELKKVASQVLALTPEMANDRAHLSVHLYKVLSQKSEWKNMNIPLTEILKIMEQHK